MEPKPTKIKKIKNKALKNPDLYQALRRDPDDIDDWDPNAETDGLYDDPPLMPNISKVETKILATQTVDQLKSLDYKEVVEWSEKLRN
jgi:hypothetical protein